MRRGEKNVDTSDRLERYMLCLTNATSRHFIHDLYCPSLLYDEKEKLTTSISMRVIEEKDNFEFLRSHITNIYKD